MHLTLSSAVATSHKFLYVCTFTVIEFRETSSLKLLEVCCIISKCLEISSDLLVLISSLVLLWSKNTSCMISVFISILSTFYDPRYGLHWYMFYGHLKRMYILLMLVECSINVS